MGLSGLLTFDVIVVNSPNVPFRWISWVFLEILGSAIIFTSASIPEAKLRVEETLIFFGNLLTASDAFPENIIISSSPSNSKPKDRGGFLVINVTDSISPNFAALTVSIPVIAPVGKYILAPFF